MKTLNLDALAKVNRTITLGGVTHDVVEMTVENFIATTKAAQALEQNKEATLADQVEATIGMIQRSVPTIPSEALRALNFEQLATINKFLRGELDGDKPAADKEEGTGAGN